MYEDFFENQIPTPLQELNSQSCDCRSSNLPLSYQSVSKKKGYILGRLSIYYIMIHMQTTENKLVKLSQLAFVERNFNLK